jgi:nucleoside 2-deoxyribosyltransferase
MKIVNRLKGQRVYLAGAMDRVPDKGSSWRNKITPFLEELNIVVFDPLKKPGTVGLENEETHLLKKQLKSTGQYDQLAEIMKTIRSVDLRLIDISDFLIVHLDIDTHPCGTLEEIFLANRQKKPIIIHIEQGKQNCPDWLFGAIPHDLFFDEWSQVIEYLYTINSQQNINTLNRWWFLNDK